MIVAPVCLHLFWSDAALGGAALSAACQNGKNENNTFIFSATLNEGSCQPRSILDGGDLPSRRKLAPGLLFDPHLDCFCKRPSPCSKGQKPIRAWSRVNFSLYRFESLLLLCEFFGGINGLMIKSCLTCDVGGVMRFLLENELNMILLILI